MRQRGIAALLGMLALVGVLHCSLTLPRPPVIFRLQAPYRDAAAYGARSGPALGQFQYYALAVSGNVGDSFSAGALENRSPACLYLNGNVTFPITYAQLTSAGVPLTLATGKYRFTVLGFHNTVTTASSLPQLFRPGQPPEVYMLAQANLDVAAGTASLQAVYNSVTPDRVQACPPADPNQFVLRSGYRGLSGAPSGSVFYSPLEAAIPPQDGGVPLTTVSDLFSLFQITPVDNSKHLRLDAVFDPPVNVATLNGIRVEVRGLAGNTAYSSSCGEPNYSGGDFALGVWRADLDNWATNAVAAGPDSKVITLNAAVPPMLIQGKLLVTVRSNSYASVNSCVGMALTSINVIPL